ncbi:MAG TPA: exosortase A, partial [Rhodopila sp.]|nr:exosortase A [Rhodopila sp.]
PSWRSAVLPLVFGLLLLGVVFRAEAAAAVRTWNVSTAYNHCFLVIPISLYLLWDRRDALAEQRPAAWPAAALLGVPLGAVWLTAERLGIMEARQLAAVSFVEVLFLAVLGRRLWRAMCGPLLYLYFLVPAGAFLTPALQDVTTFFIRHGLDILGVPAFVDGYTIEIAQGTFLVAEACAGLRFLVASVAFGCLYALLMYRSAMRRAAFITASVIVPIVANGLRGIGIVYLGHLLDSTQAAAADHVIYGWVFFSLVILLLTALGPPFREDHPAPRLPVQTEFPGSVCQQDAAGMLVAALVTACIGALAPAAHAALPSGPAPDYSGVIPTGAGCTAQPGAGQGDVHSERITCGDVVMDLAWQIFPPRTTAGPVLAARYRMTLRAATEGRSEAWSQAPGAWRHMTSNDPAYVTAVCIWFGGQAARPGLAMRARMAWNSLGGSPDAPIIATLTPVADWARLPPGQAMKLHMQLESFLSEHPQLTASLGALSAQR